MTHEQTFDFISLGVLAVMFWIMFALELRRTWHWDKLGTMLTVMTGCLAISYSVATFGPYLPFELWNPPVRYTIRALISASGVATILVLIFDNPPTPPPHPRRMHHDIRKKETP